MTTPSIVTAMTSDQSVQSTADSAVPADVMSVTTPAHRTTQPAKSILKKTATKKQQPLEVNSSIVAQAKASRTAVAHAKILEDRKRHDAHVLHCIIQLLDLPAEVVTESSSYSLTQTTTLRPPSVFPRDRETFTSLVRTFQPSDYDDLIEERNAYGRCGYVLCPNLRRRVPGTTVGGRRWKVHNGQIVPRAEVERWCSDACARRAMYVKVQLSETAAWEREGIPSITIDLMEEEGEERARSKEYTEAEAQLQAARTSAKKDNTLASERKTMRANPSGGLQVDVTIREKAVTAAAQPPALSGTGQDNYSDTYDMIEGHKLKIQHLLLDDKISN